MKVQYSDVRAAAEEIKLAAQELQLDQLDVYQFLLVVQEQTQVMLAYEIERLRLKVQAESLAREIDRRIAGTPAAIKPSSTRLN